MKSKSRKKRQVRMALQIMGKGLNKIFINHFTKLRN